MREQELLSLRLAIIDRVVASCQDIGKTKIQKITYFLQESIGVPLAYRFRIHYFGPYSDDLDGVLSLAKALGIVNISPDSDGFGYHVTPGAADEGSWSQAQDVSEHPKWEDIDRAVSALSSLETHKLELYATIHFIVDTQSELTKDDVLETVSKVKPKFTRMTVENAYQALQDARLI